MTMGAILEILFEKQKRLQVPPPESEQLTGHLSTPAPPPGGCLSLEPGATLWPQELTSQVVC